METYNFLNELPISYLHVFTFSERANTEAAEMEGVVPDKRAQAQKQNVAHPQREKAKGIL
jgi:tRNA A37 methylthiotransferase MiaB